MSRQLRSLRVLKGYTVQNMAEAIGKAMSSYSTKERGDTSFDDNEKIIIAKMLDLNYEQFNAIFFDGKLELKD